MNEMNFKEGDTVRLKEPVKGYTVFTLTGKTGYKWIGECSSGMKDEFYEDEIEERI